ncbi:hypothetical protein NC652_010066 [Populus alba x Populus x berolinensis]|nr:hypothetical protein NC652_010066 [Populus alba x Populus x berolinensis]
MVGSQFVLGAIFDLYDLQQFALIWALGKLLRQKRGLQGPWYTQKSNASSRNGNVNDFEHAIGKWGVTNVEGIGFSIFGAMVEYTEKEFEHRVPYCFLIEQLNDTHQLLVQYVDQLAKWIYKLVLAMCHRDTFT